MACGLPVICTTNTGGPDVVRNEIDGYIIPIRDVAILNEKILYLYKEKELLSFMRNNVLDRVKEFTWDTYGERIIAEYCKVFEKAKLKV